MPLRALEVFLESVFKLVNIPIVCLRLINIGRRTKQVEVSFKTKTRSAIHHLTIAATGLALYG